VHLSPAPGIFQPMPTPASRRSTIRLALIALGVVALVGALIVGGPTATLVAQRLRSLAGGPDGTPSLLVYALAAGFTFLAVLTPLPAEAAALLNGTLFPPLTAFLVTWISAMAGAAASYECGLRLGHRPAERLFGATRLARVQRLVDHAGWPTLLALRLSPVMAFTAINWASGILALSRPVFYWTVAVGLVPGTWVFTMAPELLLDRRATTRLVVIAAVVMLVLFGLTWGRVRRSVGRQR
jgi:uncharacterized membrane protein YdjX (TVP38/TMEM64 family)